MGKFNYARGLAQNLKATTCTYPIMKSTTLLLVLAVSMRLSYSHQRWTTTPSHQENMLSCSDTLLATDSAIDSADDPIVQGLPMDLCDGCALHDYTG